MAKVTKEVSVRGETYLVPQRPLSVKEAAEILGVGASVVRDRVSKKKMRYIDAALWPNGKCPLVDAGSVVEYLHARQPNARWHSRRRVVPTSV